MLSLTHFKTLPHLLCFLCIGSLLARELNAEEPAQVADAARVLNLAEFPLVEPLDEPAVQLIGRQQYRSKLALMDVAEKIRRSLQDHGCTESAGGTFMEAYGSAVYQKDGFTFSLTLMPDSDPKQTKVNLLNHGNLDLAALSPPADCQPTFVGPNSIGYQSQVDAATLKSQYRQQLIDIGWEPFGETTVSFFLKRNAVLAQFMISPAPPNGAAKSMIQISTELMSVDFPSFAYDGQFQYSDATGGLSFSSPLPQADFVKELRTKLATRDWQATTDQPIKIDFSEHLIFRNPSKDYLEVIMRKSGEKTSVRFKHQTAKAFAATEQRAQEKRGNN